MSTRLRAKKAYKHIQSVVKRIAEATETNYIRNVSLINRGIKFASAECADEIELNFERKSFVL